jgi:hypothetical protein
VSTPISHRILDSCQCLSWDIQQRARLWARLLYQRCPQHFSLIHHPTGATLNGPGGDQWRGQMPRRRSPFQASYILLAAARFWRTKESCTYDPDVYNARLLSISYFLQWNPDLRFRPQIHVCATDAYQGPTGQSQPTDNPRPIIVKTSMMTSGSIGGPWFMVPNPS